MNEKKRGQDLSRAFTSCFVTRDKTRFEQIDLHDFDWQEFTSQIRQTRLPLLMQGVMEHSPEIKRFVPETIQNQIKQNYYGLLQETILRQESLKELLTLLDLKKIEAVILRGDALSQFYYDNPVLRPAMDIDLLVRPRDLKRLEEALAEIGVRPIKEHGEIFLYYRDAPRVMNLDIHTELWYVKDPEELWERIKHVDFFALPGRILSPEDLLLHLIAHSIVHHGRFSLEDAVDLALVLEKTKDFNWELIERLIQGSSFSVFLYFAFKQTQKLTGYPVSGPNLERFKPKGWHALLCKILQNFISSKEQPYICYFLKPLSIPSIKNKGAFFINLILPPAPFMRERYRLKYGWQVPFAYLIRPLLLFVYALRALIRISLGKNHDPRD